MLYLPSLPCETAPELEELWVGIQALGLMIRMVIKDWWETEVAAFVCQGDLYAPCLLSTAALHDPCGWGGKKKLIIWVDGGPLNQIKVLYMLLSSILHLSTKLGKSNIGLKIILCESDCQFKPRSI